MDSMASEKARKARVRRSAKEGANSPWPSGTHKPKAWPGSGGTKKQHCHKLDSDDEGPEGFLMQDTTRRLMRSEVRRQLNLRYC